jgi:hypothetical protein
MKKGYFYSHQGWTDIINCLPLLNFYSKKYDQIFCFYREDSYELVQYYIKQFNNVFFVSDKLISLTNMSDGDILFHGLHDHVRNDIYNNKFINSNNEEHFVSKFYNLYNISHDEIINSFELKRDFVLENSVYENFLNENKQLNYILTHEPSYNSIDIKNKIDKNFNLDNKVKNIFSYIKVLENSKELHLVDSVWASLCYLLDCKYNLFKDKKIFLYPYTNRSGGLLKGKEQNYLRPINLKNWILIT